MRTERVEEHRMHAERGEISETTAAAINATRSAGGKVVAVGTTSVRLLESAAAEDGTVRPFTGSTDIFITPGHRFRVVDRMMTNFHLPKSTLFMLVCAFAARSGCARPMPCHRRRLPFLLLRRRLPAGARPGGSNMSLKFTLHATDGAAPRRHHAYRARPGANARVHARRHRRHGEGDDSGFGARHRRLGYPR